MIYFFIQKSCITYLLNIPGARDVKIIKMGSCPLGAYSLERVRRCVTVSLKV